MNRVITFLRGWKRGDRFPEAEHYVILMTLIISAIFLLPAAGNAQMFWNQAASFNGTPNSYIAVRHAPELNITGSFTIECWVKPSASKSSTLVQKRLGSNSEGYTLHMGAGNMRPGIRTNITTRLYTRAPIPIDSWTHVAVTYNQPTDQFTFFINGFTDTATTVAGAAPASSTDSLFIGKDFNGEFAGDLDEIRIWNRALSSTEIARNWRSSLGTTGDEYDGLVLSMTFQAQYASGSPFSLSDWSGNGNSGLNRGVQAVDMSNAPMTYLTFNESILLQGSDDYLAGPSSSAVSPASEITLEAWVLPMTASTGVLFNKGLSGTTPSYRFFLLYPDNTPRAGINNTFVSSTASVPVGEWSHVAFTYTSSTQTYQFFVNGNPAGSGSLPVGPIAVGTDSLLIGGGMSLADFNGYIDEARISKYVKTEDEIRRFMYASIENFNEPNSGLSNVSYNFDGLTWDNCVDGGPLLQFRGEAVFSSPSTAGNRPVSPMTRADDLNFTEGYYLKTSNRRIPETMTSGVMLNDSLYVNRPVSISDVNLFLATNHTYEGDLDVTLIAPNGDSLLVEADKTFLGVGDNLITIYDDQADSAQVNSTYTSFSPRIQPENSLNSFFTGMSSQGTWQIKIVDDAGGDTGRLYAWGLQFNNAASLLEPVVQGVDVNPSWNLLSLPLEAANPLKTDVFPTATSSAFTYGLTGYQNADTLEPGKAFWLKFGSGSSIPVTGFELFGLSVPVNASWNMVGSISSPIATSSITSNPPGIVTSQFFEYLGLYLSVDTLRPGKGYWVKVTQAGTLSLGSPPSADPAARIQIRPISEMPPPPPGDEGLSADVPVEFALGQAYPNPFNATATITYQLPFESHVTLKIYNLVGQVVKVLKDEQEGAGYKTIVWNADELSSGAYFYRMDATGTGTQGQTFTQVRKVVLLK